MGALPQPQLIGFKFCPECDGRTYVGEIGSGDERYCPTCNGAGLVEDSQL